MFQTLTSGSLPVRFGPKSTDYAVGERSGAPQVASGTVTIAIWVAVAIVMAMLALANPISRDEGQYVGPAAVIAGARPFVDYLYLQTPLGAQLSGPLARLFQGYGFIAMRIAIAMMGVAILAFVYVGQRGLGVDRRMAAACTAMLGCCYSFQFACGVVRNDALPALLAVAGIQIALLALRGRLWAGPSWCVVGLLFGAATSAKISYAVPAAGVGLFLIFQCMRARIAPQTLAAFVLGEVVGLLPCLLAWLAAPEAFLYGVFTYAATAPFQWYSTMNMAWVLNPVANVLITLGVLLLGPAMGALVLIARATVRNGWASVLETPHILLLDVLIVTGLVAALLPTPTNFQYALPMLAPLFMRLGLEGRQLLRVPQRTDRFAAGLLAFGIVLGCGYGLFFVGDGMRRGGLPAVSLTREAHWIGDRLRETNAAGFVSTLSPQVVLDTGYPLDPRYATGIYVYRSAAQLSAAWLDEINSIGPPNLVQSLDKRPPAAIIVGAALELDESLQQYATAHGYRRESSPFGTFELYIRIP